MPSIDLTDHFLIAMPAMADPYFAKSLTYICEHNEQGALGVTGRSTCPARCSSTCRSHSVQGARDAPIYAGGPVQTVRGFVLHKPSGHWQSALRVRDATASPLKDIWRRSDAAKARSAC